MTLADLLVIALLVEEPEKVLVMIQVVQGDLPTFGEAKRAAFAENGNVFTIEVDIPSERM